MTPKGVFLRKRVGDLLPLLVMGTKDFCGVFMGMIYFTFSTLPEEVIIVDSWARGLELGGSK